MGGRDGDYWELTGLLGGRYWKRNTWGCPLTSTCPPPTHVHSYMTYTNKKVTVPISVYWQWDKKKFEIVWTKQSKYLRLIQNWHTSSDLHWGLTVSQFWGPGDSQARGSYSTEKEVAEERLVPAFSVKKTPWEEVNIFFSILRDQWEIIDNPGRGCHSSDSSACCPVILCDPQNGPWARQEHWIRPNLIRDREGFRQLYLSEESREGKGRGGVHVSLGKGE